MQCDFGFDKIVRNLPSLTNAMHEVLIKFRIILSMQFQYWSYNVFQTLLESC